MKEPELPVKEPELPVKEPAPPVKAVPQADDDPFAVPPKEASKSPAPKPAEDDPFAPGPKTDPTPEPTPKPEPTPLVPETPADDPFAPAPKADAKPTPAPKPEATKPDVEDPFAPPKQTSTSDGCRLWTDDSGDWHVQAQLTSVLAGHVRLLKDNGRYSTVPLERLSAADRAFVTEQTNRLNALSVSQP